MHRRRYLASVAACGAVVTGGCVADGRIVHERHKSVRVDPDAGWTFEIDGFEGDGSVSYTVRADRRFDVYYFASRATYGRYQEFLAGETPNETPSGHGELSRAAVHDDQRDAYEASVPEDGGRKPISVEESHFFVVDHSNYGMGVPVSEDADPLDAFVDLTVYEEQLPF
jgi:hypothetical protein